MAWNACWALNTFKTRLPCDHGYGLFTIEKFLEWLSEIYLYRLNICEYLLCAWKNNKDKQNSFVPSFEKMCPDVVYLGTPVHKGRVHGSAHCFAFTMKVGQSELGTTTTSCAIVILWFSSFDSAAKNQPMQWMYKIFHSIPACTEKYVQKRIKLC